MTNPMQLIQMATQLRNNPMQMLMNSGLNIPKECMNSPEAMVKHLVSSGQVNQSVLDNAMNTVNSLGFKL